MITKAQPRREIVTVRGQFCVRTAVVLTQNLHLIKRLRTIHTLYPCRLPSFEIVCNYLRCNHWKKLDKGYMGTSLCYLCSFL